MEEEFRGFGAEGGLIKVCALGGKVISAKFCTSLEVSFWNEMWNVGVVWTAEKRWRFYLFPNLVCFPVSCLPQFLEISPHDR
jgi:hypothetical protein